MLQAQEACGPLEIDNALSMVRKLEKDVQETKASAEEGRLRPLPGETVSPSSLRRPPAQRLQMNTRVSALLLSWTDALKTWGTAPKL